MSEESMSNNIKLKNVQKSNLGPVGENESEFELFEKGVIGGSISDEFKKAQKFRKQLASQNE